MDIGNFVDASDAQQPPPAARFCMACGCAFADPSMLFCGKCGERRHAAGPAAPASPPRHAAEDPLVRHESGHSLVRRLQQEEEAAFGDLQSHADAERDRVQRMVMERRSRTGRRQQRA